MTTVADYKAMITTEICIPLAQIHESDILRIIGKNCRNLKAIENNSATTCSWDEKNLSIYIHGEPKSTKLAYTIIMALLSKSTSANGTTAPDAMVNMLGKEFVDGVLFCRLANTIVDSGDEISQDRGGLSQRKPAIFVVNPVFLTDDEKQRGRIMASELWRNAQFVTWDFKGNVIQDASMVLRRQLQQLPRGVGKYLKLEMAIGKVIFLENNKEKFSLQNAKFAIGDFRHLRFDKEITSKFRKEWEESWITQLRGKLPTLGYDKHGNTVKCVKLYHTAQREDGKCYDVVWSTDILEGGSLGDERPGTLEFVKARVRGNNPFSATVYNPATAFDFIFSIITTTRESAALNRKIEDRIRKGYRYSAKRGLLVNTSYEYRNGYTPLLNLKAKLVHETTWIRGDIKVIINEIHDGLDCTFEVKLQSNRLKRYTQEGPGEIPLRDVVEAMKDFLEAAEEINGELNLLNAELSLQELPLPAKTMANMDNLEFPSTTQSLYGTLSASTYSPFRASNSDKTKSQSSYSVDSFESKATSNGLGLGAPVLAATRTTQKDSTATAASTLFKNETLNISRPNGLRPGPGPLVAMTREFDQATIYRHVDITTPKDSSVPPHLRLICKSPEPSLGTTVTPDSPLPLGSPFLVDQHTPPINDFSDCFFDLLGSATDGGAGPSSGVLAPTKIGATTSERMKNNSVGGVGSLKGGDSGDLISWSPDKDMFTYDGVDLLDIEEEGINLLLD